MLIYVPEYAEYALIVLSVCVCVYVCVYVCVCMCVCVGGCGCVHVGMGCVHHMCIIHAHWEYAHIGKATVICRGSFEKSAPSLSPPPSGKISTEQQNVPQISCQEADGSAGLSVQTRQASASETNLQSLSSVSPDQSGNTSHCASIEVSTSSHTSLCEVCLSAFPYLPVLVPSHTSLS